MKVPYKWLCEYVNIDKNINEAADALTISGSKVEEVIEFGKEIDRVVTGKIIKTEKHPDADKLTICKVDVKDEVIQIVTGASNIKEGDIVPVALHGSSLPGGVKIKKGKLRGVESNGMLCSEVELGIADENSVHGIMILKEDTPIGEDIKKILGLEGGIIDFEITSNRADCFSVYGIAREAAATFDKELKKIETSFNETDDSIDNYLSVEVKSSLCRRYAARMIKDVKIGPSPEWMQEKLRQCDIRPINNIVDITNYVMLELGQPMHAFDYRYVKGKKIIVRTAQDDEKFKTLDGVERNLNSSMLVIADGERPIGIAGVMGGENSEIKEDTTAVIFECANFDGTNVRLTSKKLGLRTDASSKYEKDIDPNLIDIALNRACHLVELLGAGKVAKGVIDIYENRVEPYTLKVSPEWINKFLGIEIEKEEMRKILKNLEMKVYGDDVFEIEVPTFRQDVKIKEDVAEEIIRIYGYDKIPVKKIIGETVEAQWTLEQTLIKKVKNVMVSCGLYEAMTYSFISPKVFSLINLPENHELRNTVNILNPLGEDFSVMKTTGIPSLLECLKRNYKRDNKEVKLFEISKVYIPSGNQLPNEYDKLIIGMYGKVDFFDLKGVIENLLNVLGIDKAEFEREENSSIFHPGRTAKLLVRKKNAGILGEIHPNVAENYEIEDRVYVAEIDLKTLFDAAKNEKRYKPLPKFPAVSRDIAMLLDENISVSDIEKAILREGKELIESVKLFDVYKGKQIPEGLRSLAFSLTFRAEDRTLKDEEVNKVHESIINRLKEKFNAQLR
ncbi:phenylalanyl-tRNA synthetase beta subunit [Caloramator quimbayensis]|uniref:Phenylalanine--tRNA ligase beta subunit n=1 Tax=Caloramator quimbayensis TaxID=1147123 RepID=A0A1T4XIV1_9CLOT|nr:phenylalanine--tRNA ligase subunit beta [Caloramator quimbayensis]SKA89025.1 phenylalanyl-tRNA synthetase beta subunit [Caloramator quimbayensis]